MNWEALSLSTAADDVTADELNPLGAENTDQPA